MTETSQVVGPQISKVDAEQEYEPANMKLHEVYIPDNAPPLRGSREWCLPSGFQTLPKDVTAFVEIYGGVSFNRGLYRVHAGTEFLRWTSIVEEAFPTFKGRILCFSYDWLGRHFALDRARQESSESLILMLEPGTGQAFEIPASFREFHERELVQYADAALAQQFYESWLASGGAVPGMTECISYKIPLLLGGKDTIDNLELCDMEVYWSLCAQMLGQVKQLPGGTRIGRVDMS